MIWRALSGIYAANARGKVRFYVASGVARATKVLAATEIWVLLRNPHIDAVSREVLGWLADCVRQNRTDINFALT